MYATITGREINIHSGVPELDRMQEVVGGYICGALRMDSPERKRVSVDVYCNDEGLLMQLPINWVRLADMSPLAGNLIVVAGDDHTGETIAATEAEIKAVLEHLMPLMEPVTEYEI